MEWGKWGEGSAGVGGGGIYRGWGGVEICMG